MKAHDNEPFVDLHNVEFYNFTPRAILHMKSDRKGLLAVARSDRTIEVWNIASEAPILLQTLYPKGNFIIEGLAWAQGQLFSVDNDGQMLQWDLNSGEIHKIMRVTGSAASCIDVSPNEDLICVGTEEGYLNIFSVSEENGVLYQKIMDKQEGRVVCVTFDPTGKLLATGSVDNLRVWDVQTGHVLHKMSVPRLETKKEAIVWCVTFVKDLKIISGDSTGRLTVWDGRLGVQISSLVASKVDILAITATEDMENVFCSGIDPDIKSYSEITIRKEGEETRQWVRGKGRLIHNHDVHALVWHNKKLFSGGQDGFLTISSYPPKIVNKYGPFLASPSATISQEQRTILLKYQNYLEIWRLGTTEARDEPGRHDISLKNQPKKLLELKSKHGKHIIDAKLSPNGSWIVYTTPELTKIFNFVAAEDQIPDLRIVDVPEEMLGAQKIAFNGASDVIFASNSNKSIQIFTLGVDSWQHTTTIDTSGHLSGVIRQLEVSSCGKFLAVMSSGNDVVLYHYQKKWQKLLSLPKHSHAPTAMGFRPQCKSIVVAFADQKVFEYNFKEMSFVFSSFVDCGNTKHAIKGVTFDPRRADVVLLHTELGINVLRMMTEEEEEDEEQNNSIIRLKKNKKGSERRDPEGKTVVKTVKEYEHLIHLEWLQEKELIAVHINTLQLVEQLPPALKQKKFGIS
ncbi:U3 small nucleolar RNA-associated protein 4 homolog [Culicoides brevitarsis]|uniref:U3 small nucleolar RNA-associated protein 4 homolog n=1 Tax=Culicoides brevitarsis TaxID=469753 RepID=UPI00307C2B8A